MALHYSQIASFLRCQKAHDYDYVQGITTRKESRAIALGSIGHEALRALLLSRGDKDKASAAVAATLVKFKQRLHGASLEEFVEIDARGAEGLAIALRAYAALPPEDWELYEHEGVPQVEVSLRVTYKDVDFAGTPDAILRHKPTGALWLFDHKFRSVFRPPWSEDLNLQMAFYQGLALEAGIEVVGTRQYQIKPALPKRPELTTKGTMSVADIATDWETYAAACVEAGLNPDDYKERMLPKLNHKVWFDHTSTRALRSSEEVLRHWDETIVPAAQAILARTRPLRCFNFFTCSACSYRELCIEDTKQGDVEFLMQTLYKLKGEASSLTVEMEDD